MEGRLDVKGGARDWSPSADAAFSSPPAMNDSAHDHAILPAPKPLEQARMADETAVGIMNPWGDMWTTTTFETAREAQDYLESYWSSVPTRHERRPFLIVPVEVTVKPVGLPFAQWPAPLAKATEADGALEAPRPDASQVPGIIDK